jgi:hypothetical protein
VKYVVKSATFTIPDAPVVALTVPADYDGTTCMTQDAVNTAFTNWLAEASMTNAGCGGMLSRVPENPTAPSFCGGEVEVTWTVTSDCETDVVKSATFTIPDAPVVALTVPADYDGTTCMTQDAVNTAFTNWLAEASMTNAGCGGMLSRVPENPTAPSFCGGEVEVTWTVTSDCETDVVKSATFTIPDAPVVALTVPADYDGTTCMTQDAVNTAFANWLAEASMTNAGCGGMLTRVPENPTAPSFCGGEVEVTWTVTSDCETDVVKSATFTIPDAPAVALTVPADYDGTTCMTQDAVNTAFTNWLAEASMTNAGCGGVLTRVPENPTAPSFCGGEVEVTWTVTSDCETDVVKSATFTIPDAPVVALTVPADYDGTTCMTQDAVNTAFTNWLAEASMTNAGCGGMLSRVPENPTAPSFCGGEVEVTWTVTSDCETDVVKSATFTIPDAPAVALTVPADYDGTTCMTQDAVNTAFANWLAEASMTNAGCGGMLTRVPENPTAPSFCGGEVEVTWTVTSDCETDVVKSATFTIPDAPAVALTVPADYDGTTCMTQDAVNTAFTNWLAEASMTNAGCGGVLTRVPENPTAPSFCGGEVEVTWTVTSDCETDVVKSATFTIPDAPVVALTVPADYDGTTCMTQDAVNTAFTNWLAEASMTNAGCGGVLSRVPENPTAPSFCGGEVEVTWTVTSDCETDVVKSATFTIPDAPVVALTVPADYDGTTCMTQDAVNTAFANWLAEASMTNAGCGGMLSRVPENPTAPSFCGGEVEVT